MKTNSGTIIVGLRVCSSVAVIVMMVSSCGTASLSNDDDQGEHNFTRSMVATPTPNPSSMNGVPPAAATVTVGYMPTGIAFGFGTLWVVNSGDNTIMRIDAQTNRIISSIHTESRPQGIAIGTNSVWIVTESMSVPGNAGSVLRIDPSRNNVSATLSVESGALSIAVDGGYVWIVSESNGTITKINEITSETTHVANNIGYGKIAAGMGSLWLADVVSSTVKRIDVSDLRITASIPVGSRPADILVAAGAIWVSGVLEGVVWRIDPQTNSISANVRVGVLPTDLAFENGAIIVTEQGQDTVSRIDVATNTVAVQARVGSQPVGVAVGSAAIWVANSGDDTVSRID